MNRFAGKDNDMMRADQTPDLSRLLRPKSIAIVGGGAWCQSVVEQCRKMGFDGPVWPVHPKRSEIAGVATVPSLDDLPGVPDATFIGVNRHLTIDTVRHLRAMGAGGAICFASGFREAQAETGDGDSLQATLLEAAGEMPIIGPNCYGFINYLDGALLWPDQHGGVRCDSGVAILTQSSNMAINLTMQARGLPLAYVVTAGNQAQIGLAEIGRGLLADPRVSALGLHIEGVGDLRAFEALAAEARRLNKPLVALKAGKSEHARAAAVSHTASLAGSDAGGRALLARLGIAQVESLPALLETLKLLHFAGPLPSARIVSMSCSGGEASLMADSALACGIEFPPLSEAQHAGLRAALGPMVALANPLDYHTFIWNDVDQMTATFAAALDGDVALGCLIVDYPRPDRCDPGAWDCTITAAAAASERAKTPLAIISTLPEAMPEETAARIAAAGLIPLHGLDDALTAIAAAAFTGQRDALPEPLLISADIANPTLVAEAEAKAALAEHGVTIPRATQVPSLDALRQASEELTMPVVLKAEGLAHKTEAGGVALGLETTEAVLAAAGDMPAERFLLEEMITGGIAELLIGVVRDPAHGFVLTLAAGGTLTEILQDSASLLLPATPDEITAALGSLRLAPVLHGYRGQPAADMQAIVNAVLAVQAYVTANATRLDEVEINPLICTPTRAVAADALIRIGDET
ncbi:MULTISPECIES: acetate--CoA ligase family protein [unclassified Roseovarius]|uniref:acetate--CoA ligase family protein n=1 Tax=unclassified Roseovarius TaxID=2614913 RepID=UPI00273D7F90|nr:MULTISPECIES: acetate--CoA ligase family protein [unclassified Roseovarius]